MQTQNPFFDDLARMMSGAMGVAAGMREEMEGRFRQMFESTAARMDLVSREEFEVVKAMAAKAREENDALTKRVAALEAALGGAPKAKAGTRRSTAAKAAGTSRTRKTGPSKAGGSANDAAKTDEGASDKPSEGDGES